MSVDLGHTKFYVEAITFDGKRVPLRLDGATLVRILTDWLEDFTDDEAAAWPDAAAELNLRRYIAAWVDQEAKR